MNLKEYLKINNFTLEDIEEGRLDIFVDSKLESTFHKENVTRVYPDEIKTKEEYIVIKTREGNNSDQVLIREEYLVESDSIFKIVGRLWNNNSLSIISNRKHLYVLNGWNGEKYCDCWKVLDEDGLNKSLDDRRFEITPVYELDENGEYIISDYSVL